MKFNDKGRHIPKRVVKEKKLPDAEDYCKEGWCVCPGCWNSTETKMRHVYNFSDIASPNHSWRAGVESSPASPAESMWVNRTAHPSRLASS